MTDIRGSFVVDPDADADNVVMLRTQRIGLMRVELNAPVTGGLLVLGSSSSELMLTLNIAEVRVGNPLMQAAARALVGSSDSSLLRFDAEGADDDEHGARGHDGFEPPAPSERERVGCGGTDGEGCCCDCVCGGCCC